MKKEIRLALWYCLMMPVATLAQEAHMIQGDVAAVSLPALDSHIREYQVFDLTSDAMHDVVTAEGYDYKVTMRLGDDTFRLALFPHDIRDVAYTVQVATGNGIETWEAGPNITYRGHVMDDDQGLVRMSITPQGMAGFITTAGEKLFIQPAAHFGLQGLGQTVTYWESMVIPDPTAQCGSTLAHQIHAVRMGNNGSRNASACVETEVASAADYSMVQKYGGVSEVVNHMITIKNLMEPNYDVFDVDFSVKTSFVVGEPGGDPWSGTLESQDLLDDFCCWAGVGSSRQLGCSGQNGFGVSHDIGELWTNRNFSGITIGVAWVGAVCSGMFRYSVNSQNFGGASLQALRALSAHEIGHNFGAGHDSGSGFIMAPSINPDATEFSSESQSQINSSLPAFDCLGPCSLLPIDLVYFRAEEAGDHRVDLVWATASELDFDHFEIQRSVDGESYIAVDRVPGRGGLAQQTDYHYMDEEALSGDNFYRLKQVDLDGTVSYSPVEVVTFRRGLMILPNPTSDWVYVSGLVDPISGYRIFDQSGRQVVAVERTIEPDMGIDLRLLTAGLYSLEIAIGPRRELRRIVVQ